MTGAADYLRAFEAPRFAKLAPSLTAACFPLMKLMPARFMVDRAFASGRLETGGHIVETTSGTFGLAMAMLAAVGRYELTLITASSLIDLKLSRRLERLGAKVLSVDDPKGDGNQPGRLERLQTIVESNPDIYWPRQYDSPENPLAYARLAEMIVRNFGRVDCLVGCVGTGGSLCGTGGFLRELFPHLRIVAVDTHRSMLFGQPVGRRMLRGLGNSVLPANVRHDMIDEVHWVGALPAYAMAHELFRDHGIFMGPTSGAAALVARWVTRQMPDMATVVIMPDEGHRHSDTVYNDEWLSKIEGWPMVIPSEPVEIDRIGPAPETDWTRFPWRRRTLNEVLAAFCQG
ncbi:PLP-dependent cysteine synthase family protein [Mesorhizobium sp. B292B1B]|uniref:PLP-dependent cysteine synthase family protein n=1 Tax=unclassified Mesorhizobium TaxID=325217 RepID=UPI0011260C4D|nr:MULTISPECIES: PLP-dependent cysteine synthase family protein [unclassified Mesorhizobium]MCA0012024.1 PLP-dependent cysteine synthase family protein [Mesorhizobium sp. B294B1A1]MCA0038278.1 PLP-dependent cysteine synthase family protein [Mesorhizobium sp. B292B1B]TPM43999.1 PLP-dependent cysteine synthase family protein [Mesorhizobium sp. B2-3-2]